MQVNSTVHLYRPTRFDSFHVKASFFFYTVKQSDSSRSDEIRIFAVTCPMYIYFFQYTFKSEFATSVILQSNFKGSEIRNSYTLYLVHVNFIYKTDDIFTIFYNVFII